jgi:type II secretory pathway component GspD/PulD (secretin)
MVNSSEMVIIGGLIKEMETKSIDKVWLLGDIPLLGYLFRHTVIKKEKKDLTIFITTRIMD